MDTKEVKDAIFGFIAVIVMMVLIYKVLWFIGG